LIAKESSQENNCYKNDDIYVAMSRSNKSGTKKKRVSGQEKTKQDASFNEDNYPNNQIEKEWRQSRELCIK